MIKLTVLVVKTKSEKVFFKVQIQQNNSEIPKLFLIFFHLLIETTTFAPYVWLQISLYPSD